MADRVKNGGVVKGLKAERGCNICNAKKADGGKCKRKTCVIGPMCWQHTQRKYKVRVKPAKYGMGLFAEKIGGKKGEIIFKEGDFICWYSKTLENPPAVKDNVQVEYGLGNRAAIHNPYKTNDFPGRYANDCNDIEKVKKGEVEYGRGCTNAFLHRNVKEGKARVYADKTIKQGEEVLVSYGKGYWFKQKATKEDLTGQRSRKKTERLGHSKNN